MNQFDWLQVIAVLGIITFFTPILGRFMAQVFQGEKNILSPVGAPMEKFIYRLIGTSEHQDMTWKEYLGAVLIFNILGFVFVFLVQILQAVLPLNPLGLAGVPWHLAFNTAVSFVTNTNWQSYSGENTMSYFTQMIALAGQNTNLSLKADELAQAAINSALKAAQDFYSKRAEKWLKDTKKKKEEKDSSDDKEDDKK